VPVDYISVPLSALAFGGLVYGLSSFGEPVADPRHIGLWALAIGGVSMVIFLARQLYLQKGGSPLLDLRTFTSKNFSIAVLMMAIAMLALFGVIVLLPIYMQNVLGFDVLGTGLLLLPGGLLMGIMGPQVGKFYDKFGPRPLLLPGSIMVAGVLWAMTLMSPQTWWVNILIGHLVMSIGLAMVFTPLFTVSLSSVKPELYSYGSAMLGTIQQVAGAAGVALLVSIMSATTARQLTAGVGDKLALSTGITTALTAAAVISLFAIAASVFIKRVPGGSAHGH